jgi:pantoate--beta-alanine ligase
MLSTSLAGGKAAALSGPLAVQAGMVNLSYSGDVRPAHHNQTGQGAEDQRPVAEATRLIVSLHEMREVARQLKESGRPVGLVPTMGALHEGHLSLVRRARAECSATVVSIFVNPTQFGPGEDLARYPRNLDRDLELLKPYKVDAVFAPQAEEMYPPGFETFVDPGGVARILEGAARPGHFRGVATVVLKLFNLVQPSVAYFGQKDFQQFLVIRKLVEDFNLAVELVLCPIIREPDGLAFSSRNAYLGPEDRRAACALYRSLAHAQELFAVGERDASKVREEMRRVLAAEPRVKPEYVALTDAQLRFVSRLYAGCVALVAARVGPARLIDNLILGPPTS